MTEDTRQAEWSQVVGRTHTARLLAIRREIEAGTYETPDKLEVVERRLLEEIWDRR